MLRKERPSSAERARSSDGHGIKEKGKTRRNEGHAGHTQEAGSRNRKSEGDLVLRGQRCVWLQLRVSCSCFYDDFVWPLAKWYQKGRCSRAGVRKKRDLKRAPGLIRGALALFTFWLCFVEGAVGKVRRKGKDTNISRLGRVCCSTAGRVFVFGRNHHRCPPFLPIFSSSFPFPISFALGARGGKSKRGKEGG